MSQGQEQKSRWRWVLAGAIVALLVSATWVAGHYYFRRLNEDESGQYDMLRQISRDLAEYRETHGAFPIDLTPIDATRYSHDPESLHGITYSSDGATFTVSCIGAASHEPMTMTSTDLAIYVQDLEDAKRTARRLKRHVLLYTGQAEFCVGKNPETHFLRAMMPAIPALGGTFPRLVICERFIYASTYAPSGKFTTGFRVAMDGGFRELQEKYDLHSFEPAFTVIDPDGSKIAGPFGKPYDNFPAANEFFTTLLPK